MSQFGSNTVHTDFTANVSGVVQGAEQAGKAIDDFKTKAESGTTSFVDGFKKSVGAITSFIGALTAAIGVAKLFFEIGKQIRETYVETFESSEAAAKKFKDTLDFTNAQKTLAETRAEIERLTTKLNTTGGFLSNAILGDYRGIGDKIKEVQKIEINTLAQLRAKEDAIKQKQFDTAVSQLYELFATQDKLAADRAAKEDADGDAALAAYIAREDAKARIRADREDEANIVLEFERDELHQKELERIRKETDFRLEGIARVSQELRRLQDQAERFNIGSFGNLGVVGQDTNLMNAILRNGGAR